MTRSASHGGGKPLGKHQIAHALAACLLAMVSLAGGQVPEGGAQQLLRKIEWRSIGPASMSGRVVDIGVPREDKSVIYVASASGGVWKTVNGGTTWNPVFEGAGTQTIGDLAVAPSNAAIVWVGTGEANNQRSSYSGNGVYKSEDAGATWQHMGLPESHHIGRILIHPEQPEIVYVAAAGHLYSPNPERGLYRTRDGGVTWELVHFVSEDTGFIDAVMDPHDSRVLYAASYQRRRRAWHLEEAGPESGVWKSEDGGDTWRRLEAGLPSGNLGRIGLSIHPGDPATLYVCVENRNPRAVESAAPEVEPESRDLETRTGSAAGTAPREVRKEEAGDKQEEGPAQEARRERPPPIVGGEIYRSNDGGATFEKRNEKPVSGEPPYYYGQIRVDPVNPDKVWLLGVSLFVSVDGGRTWKNDGARGVHVDHHALWIDPDDPEHLIDGNDGGLAITWDSGRHWDVLENLPLTQFYAVAVDDREPYRIYGGLQDNGSFGVPSAGSSRGGIPERELFRINGGDGFYCAVDPERPEIVYSERQFGGLTRVNLDTWERADIRPPRERGNPPLRWNWMSPFLISPHDPSTIYFASQRLHRSSDRGGRWEAISPDLSTRDTTKIRGNVPHCTITTIDESPRRAGLLWVGTDDGNVQMTHDGGKNWRSLAHLFPSEVQGLWVSRVVASHHEPGRAYVTFTGYREDRFEPWVFVTEDYGGTWQRLAEGLPASPINALREDRRNADLLFVGTDNDAWVSLDAGDSWSSIRGNMPPVAVHDFAIQDRMGDLVAATHGRGIFILDVLPLQELTEKARAKTLHLCRTKLVVPRGPGFSRGFAGARHYLAPDPEEGLHISYHFREDVSEASLEVLDAAGRRIQTLPVERGAGLHRLVWNLRPRRGRAIADRTATLRRGGGFQAPLLPPADYVLELRVGDTVERQVFSVPPQSPSPALTDPDTELTPSRGFL